MVWLAYVIFGPRKIKRFLTMVGEDYRTRLCEGQLMRVSPDFYQLVMVVLNLFVYQCFI